MADMADVSEKQLVRLTTRTNATYVAPDRENIGGIVANKGVAQREFVVVAEANHHA